MVTALEPARGQWIFHGDDWTELGQVFSILCDHDDDQTAGHIRRKLRDLAWSLEHHKVEDGKPRPEDLVRVEGCRRFLGTLLVAEMAKRGYDAPLWHGLSLIKDDWTFLMRMSTLLEHMWT